MRKKFLLVLTLLILALGGGGKLFAENGNVAKVGNTEYATIDQALAATKTMTGDVTVEIYDKVTFNQPLIGDYTSINFVGKDTDAEMYLDVQGYTTATGKEVTFTDLKLSKSVGGYIANAGFMNVAFGIYDVVEVTYTNCTFENGACASSGKVTFNGCTFKKSWDKYGLWAYGNVDVTVQNSTFADYRGIKMYAENGANASVEKPNLVVKNTNFSAVQGEGSKPAIVLTYGESVTLESNTYSSTGVFELDLDGKPNGVAVTSDVAPTCINDNGACGVLVDGKIYTTVAQAAEVATSTSTVTLLHNSTETVEFPMGVTLEKNGFEAKGVTVVVPVAQIGTTPYTTLEAAFKAATSGCTIDILSDVTVDSKWDCRYTGAKFTVPVTINGNGKTIKFTGSVSDSNWNTVFRFEDNATVKNLTVDIANATGAQRVISAKKSLNVDALNIVGSARYGIIFGEGANAADLAATEIVVKNSTLNGTRRAISDNEGGKDVKSVVITGNTLKANAYISASESIVFNNNTANGEVDLRSYTAENVLGVEAKGNILKEGVKNYIYAKTIDAQDEFETKNPPLKVSNKAELDAALAAAKEGNTITLTADIDYGTTQLAITKAITLDLGGKTLTTQNAYGGMSVKDNPTIKNGTIVHKSNTAAIKVWNATAFENLVIDVQGKGDANKTIGGIVLQSGGTTRVGSIKNVTIKGAALTNGIETYNCGNATENVIGAMENVTINAQGTGMLISAPCGTATNCSISGGTNGIEIWIKGNYSASLDLVASKVEGGVYAHDEFINNPDAVNNGKLSLTADNATTGAGLEDVTLTIARAEAENVKGVLKDVMEAAQAKIGDTYYTTIEKAFKAAQAGQTVTILRAGKYSIPTGKDLTITGAVNGVVFENIGAYGMGGANVTFNNVTFTYANNSTYKGLQHSGNLVYNNCTFNGQVFLYGASETFNNCTFNTTDSNNYNVWTYGAKEVAFNECTFNCAGKSVLIYNESPSVNNNVAVTKSQFNASQAVEGKAAIEMDSSLQGTINLTIDGETTATGFAAGNVSGNSLWNNKKDNNDITVVVNNETVLAPINGDGTEDNPYLINNVRELVAFRKSVNAGKTEFNAPGVYVALNADINLEGTTWEHGIGDGINATFNGIFDGRDNTIKNFTMEVSAPAGDYVCGGLFGYINGAATIKNLVIENATITATVNGEGQGHNVGVLVGFANNNGGKATIDNVTVKGDVKVDAPNVYGVGTIVGYSYRDMGTISNCTVDAVAGSYIKGYSFVGGITGYSYSNAVISNCSVENLAITATSKGVGGIAGLALEGNNISGCTVANTTTVNGETNVAYIIGELGNSNGNVIIENCTAPQPWVGGAYATGEPFVATIGTKYYTSIKDAIKAVKDNETIVLIRDITMDYNARDSYETQTQNIVIDGKGYVLTLNQNNSDWASIGLANGSKLVLSNMTIEKTGYGDTSGAWNTHAIIFSCPLEMNNVTVNNGIAVQAGATLNGVTINEANGYYGLWINGNGQEVTVNGGAINATNGGRGIKIADQYIDAPAQVTLNVDGTVFNTAKKAAVLVTSTAGAQITATNVDITNVASDNTNFAWVDEARANYFGNVTLNNGNAYVEGGEESYEVSAKTDGVFGYYKKLETALAANNTSDITILRPITIANGETRVLDLNGKTVTGTDNGTASYGLFTNKGNLTINDTKVNGKITLTAKNNRGWNAYSSVISNQVGGKLTVNDGTIEHLGGTAMAYGIDNLTNGKGTYAETVVNGGTVKSTYRAIRQFLNGIEAQNILTVNGGTIESTGGNKSIWMQDPSANANSGTLTVGEEAILKGDAYLDVTAGSTEWPVVVSIAKVALQGESTVVSENVPAKYQVKLVDGYYTVVEIAPAAKIGETIYYSLAAAINAATNGQTITLLRDVNESFTISKSVTIDGAGKKYTGTMTGNKGLNITIQNVNFVNAGFDKPKAQKSSTGTYTIKNCTFEGDGKYAYSIRAYGASTINVENCTVNNYLYSFLYVVSGTNTVNVKDVTVTDCPNYAVYFASGVNNGTIEKLTVNKSNNGIIYNNSANRALTLKYCKFENVGTAIDHTDGETNTITCNLIGVNNFGNAASSVYAEYVLTAEGTTLEAPEGLVVTTPVEGCVVKYDGGVYSVVQANVKNSNTGEMYATLQEAINDAAVDSEQTLVVLKDINLNNTTLQKLDGQFNTYFKVEGKTVTIDLNGKTISGEFNSTPMLVGVFSTENNGHLTLVDNSDEGTALVDLESGNDKVYTLIANYESGCSITINGGTYILDKAIDSHMYTGGNEGIVVNGGKFILGNVGDGQNGKPWIFNTVGANERHVIVNGGTFNADINHQYWAFEVFVPETLALKSNEENDTWTVVDAEAYVLEKAGDYQRNVGYATLEEAFAVAMEKDFTDVVLVEENVVLENTLTVNAGEQIVLDLNGNVISGTCNAGESHMIMVQNTADLTIKDSSEPSIGKLTYAHGTSTTGWVIDLEGKLTLESGTLELTGNSWSIGYAVDVRPNSWGSEYTEGTTFTMNGGNIVSSDGGVRVASSSAATHENVSASFVMNGGEIDAAWDGVFVQQSNAIYDVLSFTMNDGTIKSDLNPVRVYGPAATGYVNGEDCMNIAFNGGTMTYTGTEVREWIIEEVLRVGGGSTIETILESGDITASAAFAQANELPRGYGWEETAGVFYAVKLEVAMINETGVIYSILQDAFDAAQNGQTITVLEDIDLTEGVTVAAGKVVTLDLNYNTVTGTPTEAKAYAVITNNGNLTVKNGSIICDHKLAGSTGYAVNAITNGGTLTIDGATVENNSTAQYQIGYAIDNNSTTGNAEVVVKSGAVRASGSAYYDGIRQFCNSLTNENSVTIEGGEVSTLWMQNPSDGAEKNTKDVKGSFSITGGKVGVVSTEPSANFTASITAGEIGSVEYFQKSEGRNLVNYIKGGKFKMDVTEPFCAYGYTAKYEYDEAGYNYIVKITYGKLKRELSNGWNWFSSYVDIEGKEGLDALTNALGTSGIQIKENGASGAFIQYDENDGWSGLLEATSSTKMYSINTSDSVTVEIEGTFYGVENYETTLHKGWNYLSYPHYEAKTLAEVLRGFEPVQGDVVKYLTKTAIYNASSNTWIGALTQLQPGEGYMYSSKYAVNKLVSYTTETTSTRSSAKLYLSEATEYWTIDVAQYPNNMTMIATLDVEGGDYEVAAFVDGELRGSVRPVYVEELDQYIMVLTILGDEVANMTFKYYDYNTSEEYTLNNVAVYSNNAVLGSLEEPYALTRGTTGIGEATISDINIYPNPTTTDREINLQATCDKVEVFNTLGVKVAEYQNVDTIDALETAGTYVIRVTLNGDVKHCRLIVK